MWPVIIAIAIPFLFVIGIIYSAIKDQKRLENGPLKDLIAKKKEQRLNTLKKSLQDKLKDSSSILKEKQSLDINLSNQGHLLSNFEILDNKNRAKRVNQTQTIKDIDKFKKIDSLLNKLDTMQSSQNKNSFKIDSNALKQDYFIQSSSNIKNIDTLNDDKKLASSDDLKENEFLRAYKEQDVEAKKKKIKDLVVTPNHVFEQSTKEILDKLDRAIDEVNK